MPRRFTSGWFRVFSTATADMMFSFKLCQAFQPRRRDRYPALQLIVGAVVSTAMPFAAETAAPTHESLYIGRPILQACLLFKDSAPARLRHCAIAFSTKPPIVRRRSGPRAPSADCWMPAGF